MNPASRLLDAMLRAQDAFIRGTGPDLVFSELLAVVLRITGSRDGSLAEFDGDAVQIRAGKAESAELLTVRQTGRSATEGQPAVLLCGAQSEPDGALVLEAFLPERARELEEVLPSFLTGLAGLFRGARARRDGRRGVEAILLRDGALAAITSAVAILDITQPGHPVVYCNAALAEMSGYAREEIIGLPYSFMAGAETDPVALQEVNAALQAKRGIALTLRTQHRDGTLFWNRLSYCPVTSGDGEVRCFVAVGDDITWKLHSEAELRRAKDQAEEAARYKSQLLANISHEIRTPMNAVIGMAGVLLETRLTAEQRDYVEIVRGGGEGLLSIINEILDFSKIDSGKLQLECEPFALRSCIESSLDLMAAAASGKGLEINYLIRRNTPDSWLGDNTRLRQILINLLANAVKFTEKGSVHLSIDSKPLTGASRELHFAVSDTGMGISREKIEEIFKPFHQADASTTRRHGGTGLGLSISRQLTEMMGGRMWAESTPGVGSTFHFTLRLESLAAAQPAPAERCSSLEQRRVLVIDRAPASREVLHQHLEEWKMNASVYSSLAAASAGVPAGRTFDVAIVDNDTPGLSVAALRRLTGDVPWIVTYSLGRRTHGLGASSDGARISWQSKPIKPSHLFESMLSWFQQPNEDSTESSPSIPANAEFVLERPFRILVVEDNPVNQKLSLLLLSRLGYRPDLAANGVEALATLKRQPYDVIFMDMHMPEMDGLEASRRIEQMFSADMRPWVIALTANAMASDRAICIEAGMRDFVSKPIRANDLRNALDRVPRAWTAPEFLTEMLVDEPETAHELLTLFLESTQTCIEQLNEASVARNKEDALKLLHGVKGSCRQIGALAMGDAADSMESRMHAWRPPDPFLEIWPLENAFEKVRTEMEVRIRSLPPAVVNAR